MKKKKRLQNRRIPLVLVTVILALISLLIWQQLRPMLKDCQELAHGQTAFKDGDVRWRESNTGQYLSFVIASSIDRGVGNIYAVDGCSRHDIDVSFTKFHGWSPDDSYLAVSSSTPGSAGCGSVSIYTGDARKQIFHDSRCRYNFQTPFVFVEWLSDNEFSLFVRDSEPAQYYHATIDDNDIVILEVID